MERRICDALDDCIQVCMARSVAGSFSFGASGPFAYTKASQRLFWFILGVFIQYTVAYSLYMIKKTLI